MSNNQYGNDYGTAAPATQADLRRAKIIGSKRRPIFGYFNRFPCFQPSDGSIAVWGGAGSGKSASVFMANELIDTGMNTITFDPTRRDNRLWDASIQLARLSQLGSKSIRYSRLATAQHEPARPSDA